MGIPRVLPPAAACRCPPALGRGQALVLALALAAAPALAERPALRQFTTRDGLPQMQVSAIAQDATGYLWLGTVAGGVARYNGHRWDVFDAADGISGSSVSDLQVDGQGGLYALCADSVVRFNGKTWVPMPRSGESGVVRPIVMLGGPDGVWVGTESGLVYWDGRGSPHPVFPDHVLGRARITALTSDPEGGLWVGTRDGLFRVSGSPARIYAVPGKPEGGSVLAVLARPERRLMVSVSDAGVFTVDGATWTRVGNEQAPGQRAFVLRGIRGEPDTVWVGTEKSGAFRIRADGAVEPFGTAHGLPSDHVNAILEDREGSLWFGTDNGVVRRGLSAFVTLDESDGFTNAAVLAMAEDKEGTLWFVADDGLIRKPPTGPARTFTEKDGLPEGGIFDVAADPKGGVWVVSRKGIGRVEGDRARTVTIEGLPRSALSLATLPDGTLAVGGIDGLSLVKDGKGHPVDALNGRDPYVLAVAPDGTLWCGGAGWGVIAVRDGRMVARHGVSDGLPSDQVNGLFVDSKGALWVSTDRGAARRDPHTGRVEVYDRARGLPDSFVYWVGEDADGAHWIGTNRGAVRVLGPGQMVVYGRRDGLGDDECNEEGFLVDSKGRIWIGTRSVSRFVGPQRGGLAADPPVVVEQLDLAGVAQAPGASLPPDPAGLTFRFAALTYASDHGLRFAYRLDGLSPDWKDTDQHEVTYGALAAGSYQFELVAVTADGSRSSRPATFAFTVQPHWWETAPAAGGGLLLLLGGFYALLRVRERRLEVARERLERLVADRTEDLRRANERLAQLAVTDELTGVSNRRDVLDHLTDALNLARRQGTPLTLALADLDRFKEVNDTLGHNEGDRLLVLAARALESTLREVDVLGRYGGEEFLVVLPGTDLPGALEACERLRKAVADIDFENPVTGRRPSVSIGVAALDPQVEDAVALIYRADEALYRAKSSGRNRVVAHGE